MTEEERERLGRIRERHCPIANRECPTPKWQMREDIDFLLSLLDSQTAPIPYCLNCWHAVPHNGPAGTVDDACTSVGCDCGYYQPASPNDVVTAMRSACVEKVKSMRDSWGKESQDEEDFDWRVDTATVIMTALESLTLDQVE